MRNPTRGGFEPCWALAASGAVRRAPARLPRNPLRVITASAHRQGEGKGKPLAQGALDPDLAAMQLDELLRAGQPEARAFLLACLVVPRLAQRGEARRLVLGASPATGIPDCDLHHAVLPAGLEGDPTPFRGE